MRSVGAHGRAPLHTILEDDRRGVQLNHIILKFPLGPKYFRDVDQRTVVSDKAMFR